MNTERENTGTGISMVEFEKLIDNHQSVMVVFSYNITQSLPDKEDIVQDSFVKFYQN